MSIFIGPCSYGEPEPGSDSRFITDDSSNEPSSTLVVVGDLDMKKHRITNVKEPTDDADAATLEFVDRLVNGVDNKKVNWSGGKMTGPLNLNTHKITNLGDPEEDGDTVNKRYLDKVIDETRPYDLGRFIVFPHTDKTKSYFPVGSKRNINLNDGKLLGLFRGNVFDPRRVWGNTPIGEIIEGVMHFTPQKEIRFFGKHILNYSADAPLLPQPWTFVFSVKPYDPPGIINDILMFFIERAPGVSDSITMSWSPNAFTYLISGQNPVSIDIDTSVINHFAFEYVGRKLVVWVNGVSRKTHTGLMLEWATAIHFGRNFVGVLNLYNRELSKPEIIEHYIKYHVEPFTNDEVYL